MPVLEEFAPAKVNLALHVTGRRADGYHLLDSLVVFPVLGDKVVAKPAPDLSLTITGPFSGGLSEEPDNLVLRAARLFEGCGAALTLEKNLPVASGIGGGSADAAATLRLMARLHDMPLPAPEAILALGADLPVCVQSRSARMSGIGEIIEPLDLPPFWLVLVNPRLPVPTGAVFKSLASRDNPPLAPLPPRPDFETLAGQLAAARNDLEPPARSVQPVISEVLAALDTQPGCRLARMSGSGATCFGLFAGETQARSAASAIARAQPGWWVEAAEAC
ncbi:4-(cytidine 5'-diphospho)-2-C-methyl-D-erythritol kinase [Amaricoccus macauensis]|uniref:4-(cytidine 5'-diphospho)-2-C-methyl-D-erythritol kinase n=1 Tax=Amaricoccus macauensis TaxID=57001 RepID=UPI003C7CB53D